ncbi:hypothetical protein [Shewanella sp.]|uniref:hypothetical protein n=1 Tax=Shewanella sp. TaxID=50422 RepID=UPI0040489DCD
MQIGCCWFDTERHLLVDQAKSTQWHLNVNEYWVLTQLVQHRGQVVPLSQLDTVDISGNAAHQLTHTELVGIIYHLIDYLCASHHDLIEYIPEQGVILYPTTPIKHPRVLELPNRLLSLGQYGVIIGTLLAMLFFLWSHINPPWFTKADVLRQVMTSNGKVIQFLCLTATHHKMPFYMPIVYLRSYACVMMCIGMLFMQQFPLIDIM